VAAVERWLRHVRRQLVDGHHRELLDPVAGAVWQTLVQFCVGVHDLDLRDVVGPGHGSMVLTEARHDSAELWRARLQCGDLIGIAVTERHGGSGIREITTRARPTRDGLWLISGEKVWVSRLVEAAGFVVFFRDPDDRITAGILDAGDRALDREVIEPLGLGDWSWGVLRLRDVRFDPRSDSIGRAGDGLRAAWEGVGSRYRIPGCG
jgi:alkylation response protein AidB-like acyl-CoA dehydrogenase